jgi:hypothetical protein
MKPRIGLLMTIGLLAALRPAAAQTWTQTSAPTNYWNSIAASADGTKLVAAVYGGGIYTSTNSGATWTLTGAPSDGGLDSAWESVASSADGTKLVAVRFYDNPIYLSTNSGINWSTNGPSENWQSVACSSDGKKLVAVVYIGGPIYTSTNSGTIWTQATNAPDNWWQSVASSADGNKLVAAVGGRGGGGSGPIYASTNSGATWVKTFAPIENWISVASSADGAKLVAVSQLKPPSVGGSIFTSTNSGMNWTLANNIPSEPWSSVASSADGTKLIAVGYSKSFSSLSGFSLAGGIFTSTNSGAAWTQTIGPSNYWYSVVASADGNKLVVAVSDDGIYISQTMPSPQVNIMPINGNFKLSWLVPSTNFVMQQSSDLTLWADMTNAPTLNLTNLQNQVTLCPFNSSGFYRLKTP